jgi:hypothetical protein
VKSLIPRNFEHPGTEAMDKEIVNFFEPTLTPRKDPDGKLLYLYNLLFILMSLNRILITKL